MALILADFLLKSDRKSSEQLHDPVAGRDWLSGNPGWAKQPPWSDEVAGRWSENMKVFRLVVRTRQMAARRGVTAAQLVAAEKVYANYLSLLRIHLHVPTSRKEHRLVWLAPTVCGVAIDADVRRFDDLDVFWQCAFGSCMGNIKLELCPNCGRSIESLTPTGLPTAKTVCSDCRWSRWRDQHTPDEMRKRWRRLKKNQRKKRT